MTASPQDFDVAFGDVMLKGDHYPGKQRNDTLYIHGAGTSSRHGHKILREALQQRGIGTTCFDCIGHGDTGGTLAQSSVASRTRQAQAVILARALAEPLTVIAASMGAYNAIKLTQLHAVDALVLMVPGVYTPEAYELPFGPDFSTVIRRERSWVDTDAWDILARFEGALLVVAAEDDATIPLEIPERLVAAARRARSSRLLVVPGAKHNHLWSLLIERAERFNAAVDQVAACLRGE